MKLSNLITIKGFKCATIYIHPHYVVGEIFIEGKSKSQLKIWRKMKIDLKLRDLPLDTVYYKSIKSFKDFTIEPENPNDNKLYINVYEYN